MAYVGGQLARPVGQPPGPSRGAPVWVALLILGIAVGIFVATLRPPEKLRGPGPGA